MYYNYYILNNYLIYTDSNILYNNNLLNLYLINYYYFNNNNLLNIYFNELLINNIIIYNNSLTMNYNIDNVLFTIIYENFFILYILYTFLIFYTIKKKIYKNIIVLKYNLFLF